MDKCPACNVEQSDSSKFCSECGAALKPEFAATVTHGPEGSPAESSVHSSSSDSHHGRFLPGTKLGNRYRIVSLVGKGGMGEVYRADDLKLNQTVALKFLPKSMTDDPKRLEYFHSEVRLTRQISHPNVCRVYDIGEINGQHFLSMEYIDGEDLKVLLRRIGRLPKDKGVQIAQQLCAGLAAAHGQGVLHRDLKPANIMIDGKGHVRIADFGLAKLVDDNAEGEVAGTPAYMAPEQLARGEASIQSDLYALGLILYELFTGNAVHKTGSIKEIMKAHQGSSLAQPSSLVDDMEPAVERVILRCLEKEPAERPVSALAISAALPGGDPLAAALAVGETPSPEMVAAAGESGGLSLKTGITVLSVVCALLIAIPILASWKDAQKSEMKLSRLRDHEPIGLRNDSAWWVDQLVHKSSASDNADYDSVYQFDESQDFRYRKSSSSIRPRITHLFGAVGIGMISEDNPSALEPGMISVRLDPNKPTRSFEQLLEFLAVPEINEPVGESDVTTADWFDRLGLDQSTFTLADETSKNWWPPITADKIWQGSDDAESQVILATRNNRLVYFRRDVTSGFLITPKPSGRGAFLTIVALVAAGLLAYRNLKLGRADTKGALHLTLYFFAFEFILGIVTCHHVADSSEFILIANLLIYALARSLRVWFYYVGFEPYARRLWPDLLIAWSRVLSGRFRDPLVGRDLMVGALFATFFAIMIIANGGSGSLNQATSVTGSILMTHQNGLLIALYFMAVLLLCRVLVQNTLRAVPLFAILGALTSTMRFGDNPDVWVTWILILAFYVGLALLYVRFGLLSVVTGLFCYWLLGIAPHTTDFGAWYAVTGNVALVVVLFVASYGFYTSTLANHLASGSVDL